MKPCSLVDTYPRNMHPPIFWYILHWRWRQQVPPEKLVLLCHNIWGHIPNILVSIPDDLGLLGARSNAFGKQISLHWNTSTWLCNLGEEIACEKRREDKRREDSKNTVQSSWVVMPCNSERDTCHPHLQGRRVSQARNQQLPPKRRILSELKFIVTAVKTSNAAKWKFG
jgi:hypothetical protein